MSSVRFGSGFLELKTCQFAIGGLTEPALSAVRLRSFSREAGRICVQRECLRLRVSCPAFRVKPRPKHGWLPALSLVAFLVRTPWPLLPEVSASVSLALTVNPTTPLPSCPSGLAL